jgi:hypothetical protein
LRERNPEVPWASTLAHPSTGMTIWTQKIDARLVADALANGGAYFKFNTGSVNWQIFRDVILARQPMSSAGHRRTSTRRREPATGRCSTTLPGRRRRDGPALATATAFAAMTRAMPAHSCGART